jgi:enolase
MSGEQIAAVIGRQVWDSRGRPTIEVEVQLAGGARGRAIAPSGASTGAGEALDLRDGGRRFGGYGVRKVLANVASLIAPALGGLDASDQESVDQALIDLDGTPDKSRLGANACVATSVASAQAAAAAAGVPLYRWLGGEQARQLPLPEIQIFGGGAHAARRVDVQDFMVVCLRARSFAEALEWTAEVYRVAGELMAAAGKVRGVADEGGFWPQFDRNEQALDVLVHAIRDAGFTPGVDIAIALDVAASQFGRSGRYRLSLEARELERDAWIERLLQWVERYPIVSLEDPLAEDDADGFVALTAEIGERVQIVGDDFIVTDAERIRHAALHGAANTVLLKPNQRGTLSETRAAWEAAKRYGLRAILSARSGESEDVSLVHLAVGWGIKQLKVGSMTRAERTAKWNEALRIEQALGDQAEFAGSGALFERSK